LKITSKAAKTLIFEEKNILGYSGGHNLTEIIF
jgi:hypothetical protein